MTAPQTTLRAFAFENRDALGEFAGYGLTIGFDEPSTEPDEFGDCAGAIREISILDDPGDLVRDDEPAEAGSKGAWFYSARYDRRFFRDGEWRGGRFVLSKRYTPQGLRAVYVAYEEGSSRPAALIVAD